MSITSETGCQHGQGPGGKSTGILVYRQSIWTRITHWSWALCVFFLLLSGLQIFNAHPALYIGNESGFEYDNSVLRIEAVTTFQGVAGRTTIFGQSFDTTGFFGISGAEGHTEYRAFPAALTIPSYRDLATGRVIHFFFAWLLVGTLALWLAASLFNGHVFRDLWPRWLDLVRLPRDFRDHLTFTFHRHRHYGPLQKLSYGGVLFVLFPLIILTGLTMSPGMNAAFPWLIDLFGGRQTARTLHFIAALLLVIFIVVHLLMVLLAGPLNELRSMITGWYLTEKTREDMPEDSA